MKVEILLSQQDFKDLAIMGSVSNDKFRVTLDSNNFQMKTVKHSIGMPIGERRTRIKTHGEALFFVEANAENLLLTYETKEVL